LEGSKDSVHPVRSPVLARRVETGDLPSADLSRRLSMLPDPFDARHFFSLFSDPSPPSLTGDLAKLRLPREFGAEQFQHPGTDLLRPPFPVRESPVAHRNL